MVDNRTTVPSPQHTDQLRLRVIILEAVALGAATVIPTVDLSAVAADPVESASIIGALAISSVQLMIVVLIMTRAGAACDRYRLRFEPGELWRAVPIAAGALALLLAFGALLQLLPVEVEEQLKQGYRWELRDAIKLALAAPFLLLAAYREELFFRAFLITRMIDLRLPPWACVVVSSALFAAGHLYQGVFAVVASGVLGAYLAVLYLRGGGVHRVALGHALFNLVVLTATLFPAIPFATFRA